jgi:hypothetical protein
MGYTDCSLTGLMNKYPISKPLHRRANTFWDGLQRNIESLPTFTWNPKSKMEKELHQLIGSLEFRSYTGDNDQLLFLQLKGMGLPPDYLEFMEVTNGGVGLIGENQVYTDFWKVSDIMSINPVYDDEFCRSVIVIGSDGGGTCDGYYFLEKVFFAADEYEMRFDKITRCGPAFIDLVRFIASYNYYL